MGPRKFFLIFGVAFLVAGSLWFYAQSVPKEPTKLAESPKPVAPAPVAPKPVVAPQVVAPKAPPIAAPVVKAAPTPAATEPATPNAEATKELNDTIGDMATLLQAGDLAGLMDKYMSPQMQAQMPPEIRARMLQEMQQDPQMQQMMAQALQGLQGQTPTFNDAGDRATYQMTQPTGMIPPGANAPPTIPVTFMKVDGKWYTADGPGI